METAQPTPVRTTTAARQSLQTPLSSRQKPPALLQTASFFYLSLRATRLASQGPLDSAVLGRSVCTYNGAHPAALHGRGSVRHLWSQGNNQHPREQNACTLKVFPLTPVRSTPHLRQTETRDNINYYLAGKHFRVSNRQTSGIPDILTYKVIARKQRSLCCSISWAAVQGHMPGRRNHFPQCRCEELRI